MNYHEAQKQSMIRQLTKAKYCKICGQPVLLGANEEDSKWGWDNEVHWECYRKEAQKRGINV